MGNAFEIHDVNVQELDFVPDYYYYSYSGLVYRYFGWPDLPRNKRFTCQAIHS